MVADFLKLPPQFRERRRHHGGCMPEFDFPPWSAIGYQLHWLCIDERISGLLCRPLFFIHKILMCNFLELSDPKLCTSAIGNAVGHGLLIL
ncbi:hypothetical protein MTR_1g012860 [Medicago truncatula]|uniref:Uncharacterized protein n=1 Tax=Medicago truncatula TaxID=3880 RepID=A0A072VCU9_MEDTR|nr:hypothetical protein MTR_1g012860 [Medicago truncatula]